MGYLAFTRRSMSTRLEQAIAQHDVIQEPDSTDDVTFAQIKKRWRHTEDTRHLDYNDRLPATERERYKQREDDAAREVKSFEQTEAPTQIVGVYLE